MVFGDITRKGDKLAVGEDGFAATRTIRLYSVAARPPYKDDAPVYRCRLANPPAPATSRSAGRPTAPSLAYQAGGSIYTVHVGSIASGCTPRQAAPARCGRHLALLGPGRRCRRGARVEPFDRARRQHRRAVAVAGLALVSLTLGFGRGGEKGAQPSGTTALGCAGAGNETQPWARERREAARLEPASETVSTESPTTSERWIGGVHPSSPFWCDAPELLDPGARPRGSRRLLLERDDEEPTSPARRGTRGSPTRPRTSPRRATPPEALRVLEVGDVEERDLRAERLARGRRRPGRSRAGGRRRSGAGTRSSPGSPARRAPAASPGRRGRPCTAGRPAGR